MKFADVAEQTHGSVKRLVGFVQAKSLLGVFDGLDLDANPRSAKWGGHQGAPLQRGGSGLAVGCRTRRSLSWRGGINGGHGQGHTELH